MPQSKNQESFNQVMRGLEKLDSKVDKLRTEDVPGLHTRISLLEEKMINLKDDVRNEAKRDAKIYGGIGSAVATFFAVAMSSFRH